MIRPLLAVVAGAAIATLVAHLLPRDASFRHIALLLDLVPFAGAIAATSVAGGRLRRVGIRGARLATAGYGYFAGALVGALGMAHLVAVVVVSIGRGRQHAFEYDFRVYALMLLGMLLVAGGLGAAAGAARLARGHDSAWRTLVFTWMALLAINVPLVPLQGFAILLSLLAALGLLLLVGLRRRLAVE